MTVAYYWTVTSSMHSLVIVIHSRKILELNFFRYLIRIINAKRLMVVITIIKLAVSIRSDVALVCRLAVAECIFVGRIIPLPPAGI